MKSRTIDRLVFVFVVAVIGVVTAAGVAQEPKIKAMFRKDAKFEGPVETYDVFQKHPGDHVKFMVMAGGPKGQAEIRGAADALLNAESDDDKKKAEANLRELLSKRFALDMERRQNELDELQKRLEKLEEQMARRREKMDEIVDLQIKVLVNEADGLGFYSGAPSPWEVPIAAPVFQNQPLGPETTIVAPPVPVAPSAEAVPGAAPAPRTRSSLVDPNESR
jgi:hypothetical protein